MRHAAAASDRPARVLAGSLVAAGVVLCLAATALLSGTGRGEPTGGSAGVAKAAPATPGRGVLVEWPKPRPEAYEHRPRPEPVRRLTLAFTGDVLPHGDVVATGLATGFDAMLAPAAGVIGDADLAICHLEVPLSRDGTDLAGYPSFNSPPQLAGAVATAGYDGCSTASNHSLDRGAGGVASTLDVLDGAGLGHAGTARSAEEDASVRTYEVHGVRVGHVAATFGLNGLPLPADQPWLVDLVDPVDGVLAEAAAARAGGADIVVVSVHWGAEYQVEPTPLQRSQAEALLASPDVDLVVGHHAHVVQPVERHGDKAVAYGLGNFLSGQNGLFDPGTQDGVVLTATVAVDSRGAVVEDLGVTPTWVEPRSFRVLPVQRTLEDPSLTPDRRAALEASLQRTATRVGEAASLVP